MCPFIKSLYIDLLENIPIFVSFQTKVSRISIRFLDKGAGAPASASIDAHSHLLNYSTYQKFNDYNHASDKVAT